MSQYSGPSHHVFDQAHRGRESYYRRRSESHPDSFNHTNSHRPHVLQEEHAIHMSTRHSQLASHDGTDVNRHGPYQSRLVDQMQLPPPPTSHFNGVGHPVPSAASSTYASQPAARHGAPPSSRNTHGQHESLQRAERLQRDGAFHIGRCASNQLSAQDLAKRSDLEALHSAGSGVRSSRPDDRYPTMPRREYSPRAPPSAGKMTHGPPLSTANAGQNHSSQPLLPSRWEATASSDSDDTETDIVERRIKEDGWWSARLRSAEWHDNAHSSAEGRSAYHRPSAPQYGSSCARPHLRSSSSTEQSSESDSDISFTSSSNGADSRASRERSSIPGGTIRRHPYAATDGRISRHSSSGVSSISYSDSDSSLTPRTTHETRDFAMTQHQQEHQLTARRSTSMAVERWQTRGLPSEPPLLSGSSNHENANTDDGRPNIHWASPKLELRYQVSQTSQMKTERISLLISGPGDLPRNLLKTCRKTEVKEGVAFGEKCWSFVVPLVDKGVFPQIDGNKVRDLRLPGSCRAYLTKHCFMITGDKEDAVHKNVKRFSQPELIHDEQASRTLAIVSWVIERQVPQTGTDMGNIHLAYSKFSSGGILQPSSPAFVRI